jgi:tetratricopeptide (TPR) repeat protein
MGRSRIAVGLLALLLSSCSVETANLATSEPRSGETSPSSGGAAARLATPEAPLEALLEEMRDARPDRPAPRASARIESEIAGLTTRFEGMPAESADRPALARQLAEDYVELEGALAGDARNVEGGRAAEAAAKEERARTSAELYYEVIVKDHLSYAQRDEAFYYLGREYAKAGQADKARKAYFQLIQAYFEKAPGSRFLPLAYLSFADLFYAEAEGDPSQFENAKQAYIKVILFHPPDNPAYGFAWYRLGLVFSRTGDRARALHAFQKTIDDGVARPKSPLAQRLAALATDQVAALGAPE